MRKATQAEVMLSLFGLSLVGLIAALIYWIWFGDWRPAATGLVVFLFSFLLSEAADRAEEQDKQKQS